MNECTHDKRFGDVFLMPTGTNGCVACAFEQMLRENTDLRAENEKLRELSNDFRELLAVGIVASPCPTQRQWADVQRMAKNAVAAIDAAMKGEVMTNETTPS